MLLEEANERLKTPITQEQLWELSPIYCLLDFHKDEFCKLIDAIGIEKWLEKSNRWKRLDRAESELIAKERYLKAKSRLAEIQLEKETLEQIVNNYQPT